MDQFQVPETPKIVHFSQNRLLFSVENDSIQRPLQHKNLLFMDDQLS